MRILLGIIIVFAGFMMVWKTEALYRFTGAVAWAEQKLGIEGGTRTLYKLLGLLVIFIGLLVTTGLIGGFLETILAPLIRPAQNL